MVLRIFEPLETPLGAVKRSLDIAWGRAGAVKKGWIASLGTKLSLIDFKIVKGTSLF